jgi:prolyl 4-hydroxylase
MTAPSDEMNAALGQQVGAADRILVGAEGVSAEPEAATRLYEEAAAAGSGAAARRLAVLAAVGVARPASWSEALDRLGDAAELGDRAAQKQLAILADDEDAAIRTSSGARWRRLREGIDLKTLLKPPAVRNLSVAPAIMLLDGMATKAMCRWIIGRGKGRMERAMIGDYASGQGTPDPIRTGLSTGFGIIDTDVVLVLTQERLARASRLMVHQQEAPILLSYEPGQEYKPHFDFLNPGVPAFERQLAIMGQRVATCLTWLNDDYEGGETEFPKVGFRHRGKPGDAMLFLNVTPDRRPDPLSLHAGRPVTRGRKWLLSQWVRDSVQAIV